MPVTTIGENRSNQPLQPQASPRESETEPPKSGGCPFHNATANQPAINSTDITVPTELTPDDVVEDDNTDATGKPA